MPLGDTSRETTPTPSIEVRVGEESRRKIRNLLHNQHAEMFRSLNIQARLASLKGVGFTNDLIFESRRILCGDKEITFFEGIFCLDSFRYILQIHKTETGWEVTNSNKDGFEEILAYLNQVKNGGSWLPSFGGAKSPPPIPERTHTADDYPSNGMPKHTHPLIELDK